MDNWFVCWSIQAKLIAISGSTPAQSDCLIRGHEVNPSHQKKAVTILTEGCLKMMTSFTLTPAQSGIHKSVMITLEIKLKT